MRKSLLIALSLAAILCLDLWVHSPAVARLFAHVHRQPPHPLEHPFWDAQPYAAGIADYRAGRSPYHDDDLANPLPYSYPPVFVWAGSALAKMLPSPWGWRLYLFLYLASVFGLQMFFGALYLRKPAGAEWITALCLLPLTAFLSVPFLSGNIHAVWYFASALAAIPGLRHNRWIAFYLVALLATINQPVFVVLLLFPLLAGARQFVPSIQTAIAMGAAYSIEWYLNPAMNLRFQETVAAHLAVSRDFGQSIFGIAIHDGAGALLAGAIQILLSASVVALMLWIKLRDVADDRRWWALIVLAIILVNPRIMPYDAAIGLIPAACFLIESGRRGWLLALPVTILCIAGRSPLGLTPVIAAGFAVGAATQLRRFANAPVPPDERLQSPQPVSAQ